MTRWIAAAGAFVVSLDSMVNIAFPSMAAAFRLPPEAMRWVIICYVGTYALMSFGGGALADRVGHGRVFRAGLALSAVGFVLSGTAPTFGWLLGGRVVQGVAAGLVYGTAPGLVTLAAPPEERGRALGFVSAGIGLAFTAGPLIAGVLVDAFGWRAVFHIRVVPALAALAWALAALWPGRASVDHRLVSLRQIGRAPVLHASLLSFIANAGIFAIWLLAPFYLVERRGLDARAGGALFMLTPLGWTLG
ncbi:MAG: MFS transporter, partial [Candidatus Rokuibacteriota bacterium]